MSDTVIRVENVSKQYRLGEISTRILVHDLNRWWHKMRGKEDPHAVIGRASKARHEPGDEFIWALKDVNFEVKRGQVLGVIGRNGAGKSTLLKILSRVTAPTSGQIKIKGRVASLLEVGTGFHPELTGRDNIYLNGAILGMRRQEINSKLDAIVSFSECETYLDTPVKRYSSGMYVRLAFAVAAHLDPEILIVDEVLAVGDAQFQKKCLGKMNEVATQSGRTVLFVSHNMGMVASLCGQAVLVAGGRVGEVVSATDAVMSYYTDGQSSPAMANFSNASTPVGDDYAQLLECYVKNSSGQITPEFDLAEDVIIGLRFRILRSKQFKQSFTYPQLNLFSATGELMFQCMARAQQYGNLEPGDYIAECRIPGDFLNNETFHVGLGLASCENGVVAHFYQKHLLSFQIREDLSQTLYVRRNGYSGAMAGAMRPDLPWNLQRA